MARYRMTPARRRALKKAQAASARKRRGKGKGKLAAAHRKSRRNAKIAVGVNTALAAGAIGAVAYTNHQIGRKSKKGKASAPKARGSAPKTDFTKLGSVGRPNKNLGPSRTALKTRKAKYLQETRLRQLQKAGDLGFYKAGLPVSRGSRTIALGSGRPRRRR